MAGLLGMGREYVAFLDELIRSAEWADVHTTAKDIDRQFTRANVVRYLEIIVRHLDEALALDLGQLDDGMRLTTPHPVVEHLRMLSGAIADLDFGVTHEILKTPDTKKGATLSTQQRERDRVLLELLIIFQDRQHIRTRKEAARKLVRKLNQNGYRRRGKALTAKLLLGL